MPGGPPRGGQQHLHRLIGTDQHRRAVGQVYDFLVAGSREAADGEDHENNHRDEKQEDQRILHPRRVFGGDLLNDLLDFRQAGLRLDPVHESL